MTLKDITGQATLAFAAETKLLVYNEALSSGEPKPIISNVARGPKARGQHWKLLAEGHHLINSL